jgi:IS1 family transposase
LRALHARATPGLAVDSIQADEIWGWVGCKKKTALRLGYQDKPVGDAYCFTAIDKASKLLICFHLGRRDQDNTDIFCRKLAVAVQGNFQLSTDGYHTFAPAVGWHLSGRTDYGQVIKTFGATTDDQMHFGSPTIISMRKSRIYGDIDFRDICTSHCERLNGTIRNYVKRIGRLTYAFSKKWENHQAALALFFMAYNYAKPHKTLKKRTPAMTHGLTDHVWTIRELLVATSDSTPR